MAANQKVRGHTRSGPWSLRLIPLLIAAPLPVSAHVSAHVSAPSPSARPMSPPPTSAPTGPTTRTSEVLRVPAGRMAEPTAAVDPRDRRHIAVAADPYLDPTRIQVTITRDGGRTWSRRITVRPPGFDKSYDPDLAFTRSGKLLVSGGAAKRGRRFCQPGSTVFIARISGENSPVYETIAAPSPGVYLDRPALAYDPGTDTMAVSWTQSSGPGAECRAVARHSTTWIAWGRAGDRARRIQVPAPAMASYGAELAVDPAGRFLVAVAGWDRSNRQAVSVAELDPRRGVVGERARFAAGRRPPLKVESVPTLSLSAASLAANPRGRAAITWTEVRGGKTVTRIAVSLTDGQWQESAGPPADGTPLAPTVAYREDDTPLVLQADLKARRIGFTLWRLVQDRWEPERRLGETDAARYPELGELLGLATGANTVVTAVPGGRRPSLLSVRISETPVPTQTSPAAPRRPDPRHGQPESARPAASRWIGPQLYVPAGVAAIVAGIGGLAWARRRRTRYAGSRRASDSPVDTDNR
jgi:hypothetical protein